MKIQDKKIYLDNGLEIELGENINDVKSKYEKYGVEFTSDGEINYLDDIEEMGHLADVIFSYTDSILGEVEIDFRMPVEMGQKNESREEYLDGNLQFFDSLKEKMKKRIDGVAKTKGTSSVIHTLPPMTAPSPMWTRPSIVAPA